MKRISLLLIMAACTATPPSLTPMLEDTCGATNYANLIGQSSTALEKVLIVGPVRVIRPGDFVTQDFRPDRINFGIDNTDKLFEITCG
jgi:hypothetical protein